MGILEDLKKKTQEGMALFEQAKTPLSVIKKTTPQDIALTKNYGKPQPSVPQVTLKDVIKEVPEATKKVLNFITSGSLLRPENRPSMLEAQASLKESKAQTENLRRYGILEGTKKNILGQYDPDVITPEEKKLAEQSISKSMYVAMGLTGDIKPINKLKGGIYKAEKIIAQQPKAKTVGELIPKELGLEDITKQIQVGLKKEKIPIKSKAKEFFENIKTDYADRYNPISQLVKGKGLKPSENPDLLVRRYSGGLGIANAKIDYQLSPILKKTDKLDELRQLMVAERSTELAQRGIGKPATKALEELQTKLENEEFTKLQNIAEDVRNFTKAQLTEARDVGILSEEGYNKILASNEKYVPFNRVMDDLESAGMVSGATKDLNLKVSPIKKIKGSERDIIDPLESIIKNTYDITKAIEKQRVLNSLVDVGGFEKLKVPTLFEPKTPHITKFTDGKKTFYEVPKELADSIKGMDEEQLNLAIRAMAFPAKVMRAGATGLNVGFAVPNIIRDQLSAMVNSKYGGIPIYDFISGLSSVVKKDKFFKQWLLSGADQASFFSQDRTMIQRTLNQVTGKEKFLTKAGKTITSPLELLRSIGDYSEKGTRLGVFKRALSGAEKEGLTGFDQILKAMGESRSATIDFARRGSKMKAINSMIPFLNARLQGSLKLLSSFKERPVQTLLRGGAVVSVPSVTLYHHNRRYKEYDEIPQYIKDNNFIIMTGNEKMPFIKIPKGEIGQIFANPLENFLDYIYNKDRNSFAELSGQILSNFSPINGFGDIIPTAFKPPIELMTNYDLFRQQPIVSPYKVNLPPEQQFDKRTTESAKFLGKLLNVSPAKLEHIIFGYTASLGKQAFQATDIGFGKVPEISTAPVTGRFIGSQQQLTKEAQEIYKFGEEKKAETSRQNFILKQDLKEAIATKDPKTIASAVERIPQEKRKQFLNDVIDDIKKETFSPTERAIDSLPNKDKASYVIKEIKGKTKEEKKEFLINLTKKGIINKNVLEEMAKQL